VDFSGTDINGDAAPAVLQFGGGVSQTIRRTDDVEWLGSARGRLGLAPQWGCCGPLWIYGTGGVAWERFERQNSSLTEAPGITQSVVTTVPHDRFGWVAGAGGEAMLFGSNWLIRVEYLHYEFGTSETPTVVRSNIAGGSFTEKGDDQEIDVVRGGLSYKF
jgi:outer membrane immunogenic protein